VNLELHLRSVLKSRQALSIVSFLVYCFLIFENLTGFPPYFFCDEAVHGVEAQSLLQTGRDRSGEFLPLLVRGLGEFQLALSVYFQVPFNAVFGLNEFAVRARSAALSVIGVWTAFLALQYIFKCRHAWLAFFAFALSPIWFLHARAGFEPFQALVLFLLTIALYLKAFEGALWAALALPVAAAMTFYSYVPARGWVACTGLALLLVNFSVHLKQWKRTVLAGVLLLGLLSPFFYLQATSPEKTMRRIQSVGLEEFLNLPTEQKLVRIVKNHLGALNPLFWYSWEATHKDGPSERHIIPKLPLLPRWSAPLCLAGLLICLRFLRCIEYRSLVAVLVASPLSAAPFAYTSLRVMPVALVFLLFSLIGISAILTWLEERTKLSYIAPSLCLAALLAEAAWFRHHVYQVAPYLYRDYGFYGLQIGAREVFEWAGQQSEVYEKIYLAADLFNAGEIFPAFYLPQDFQPKLRVLDAYGLCQGRLEPVAGSLWIIQASFLDRITYSGCPLQLSIIKTFYDLRHKPLYYGAILQPKPGFVDWQVKQEKARRQLLKARLDTRFGPVVLTHTPFDMGEPAFIVDNNEATLVRTAGINPLHLVLDVTPQSMSELELVVSNNHAVRITLQVVVQSEPVDLGYHDADSGGGVATVQIKFPQRLDNVKQISLDLQALDADQYGFVHLKELRWK